MPFYQQLDRYYARHMEGRDFVSLSMMVGEFNRDLNRGPVKHQPLTIDEFKQPACRQILPREELVAPLADFFKIYGDERAMFLAAPRELKDQKKGITPADVETATDAENILRTRNIDTIIASNEAAEKQAELDRIRAAEQEAAHAAHAAHVAQWRARSPKGKENGPSFYEIVQDGFADKVSFVAIIGAVMKEWGVSPEQFCRHLAEKHPEGKTLTNSSFYSWMNNPEKHPNRESVATILEALVPPSHREMGELMMWRTIKGYWPEPATYDMEAEKAKETGGTGDFVTLLVESSGIPNARLQDMIGTQQLIPWKHGARIENPEKADRFLALTNPPELKLFHETAAEASAHNAEMSAALTGRPLSVAEALKRTDGITKNQAGQFLQELIGRRGLVKKTDAEIAELIGISVHMISHFKSGDGVPTEAQAHKFAALLPPMTPEEDHAVINRLTGIKTAKEMLDETWKAETEVTAEKTNDAEAKKEAQPITYSAGSIVRLTYERKGMRQEDFEKMAGISNLSNFCLDKAHLDIYSARKVAKVLGFEENSEDMRRFTLLATGVDVSKSPAQILHDVKNKDMEPYEGLRRLFDLTGLTRDELAEKAGVPTTTLRPWTTSEKGGHISVETAIPAIAKACGFEKSEHAFRAIFGGGYAARRQTPEPEGRTVEPAKDYAEEITKSRKNSGTLHGPKT